MITASALADIRAERVERSLLRMQENALSMLEDLRSEIDPGPGWTQVAGGQNSTETGRVLDLATLRTRSRTLYYANPHARNIINTYVKFSLGQGIMINFQEEDDDAVKEIQAWWKLFAKKIKLFSFLREFAMRALRDGETFVRYFPMDNGMPPVFRFMDPEYVCSPEFAEGIEFAKDDAETPLNYFYTTRLGETLTIPAREVIHFKMNVDRNVARGRPLLEPMLPLFPKYDKWLEARIVLSIVRTSLAFVKEVQGSPTDLIRMRSAQQMTRTTSTEQNKVKMLTPGSILTATPGVKYQLLSPNLDARDAQTDGRTILLNEAAGAGLPDTFVTSDFSESNFASSVVAQNPALRAFEEFENLLSEHTHDMVDLVLVNGVEQKVITAKVRDDDGIRPVNLETSVVYPPLLRRDLRADVEAWQIMSQNRVASKRTWALNMGLNPDQELRYIEEEEESNPPMLPANGNGKSEPFKKGVDDRKPREDVKVQ